MIRAGVHLANDGNVTDEHLALIRNLRLVKGLVRLDCDWDEVDWAQLGCHLRQDAAVVLRLFFPGRLDAAEFVARAAKKLPSVLTSLSPRTCYLEIHNEPNHAGGIEGWGATDADAADFADWYRGVLLGLEHHGLFHLGFPGLAVGEWAHRERRWATINHLNMAASDWIGVHCYWQTWEQIEHPQLGLNWKWYRKHFPGHRIIVTEAGNSGCDGPMGAPGPAEQAAQYRRWCELARDDVWGVAFYILGGSEDWKGFRLYNSTVKALESLT